MIVTIDGPVASGKSSVAKALAQQLGFKHLNSGMLYRAIAYLSAQSPAQEHDWHNDLTYDFVGTEPVVFWQKQPIVKELLYSPAMDVASSKVSANHVIRELLFAIQRELATRYDLVADGRDCGSVVFPDAAVKIFLTADPLVRAQRLMWSTDRHYKGMTLEAIQAEVTMRDERDINREHAPLIVPQGGVVIDSSDLNFEQTLQACIDLIDTKRKALAV